MKIKKRKMNLVGVIVWLLGNSYISNAQAPNSVTRLEKQFDKVIPFSSNGVSYYHVQKGKSNFPSSNKNGVYSFDGKEIIPCIYQNNFQDSRLNFDVCIVTRNEKSGLYSLTKKKEITPIIYTPSKFGWLSFTGDGIYHVERKGKFGILYKDGVEIIPCEYDKVNTAYLQSTKYWIVGQNGKLGAGLVKIGGKMVIPCGKYSWIIPNDKSECAIVAKGGDGGKFIRRSKGASEILENTIRKNGKWGIVDINTGKELTEFKYDYIGLYGEGLFAYNIGGTMTDIYKEPIGGIWGFIDKNGKEIFPAQYESVTHFHDGIAQVKKNGTTTFITNPYGSRTSSIIAKTDNDIPVNPNKHNEEMFLFVIANENYTFFKGADYSINDGKIICEYGKKTLGIPDKNIRYYEDATYGNIVGAIKKMKDIADVYDGDAKIIFYYSGLGMSNEAKDRYLLPVDASIDALTSTGYKIQSLIDTLNFMNTKITLAILDAPFSGTDKNGEMLAQHRGVQIAPKPLKNEGNTILCISSNMEETAFSSGDYGHSLYTYALLEKIQETRGNCSLLELIESTNSKVKKESLKTFNRLQTPHIIISTKLSKKLSSVKL